MREPCTATFPNNNTKSKRAIKLFPFGLSMIEYNCLYGKLMFELPLFPLHTVLFPGAQLRLHIFEERYKRMINHCLENAAPFGVVLIRRGMEALGPLAEPYEVGCMAKILNHKPYPDGRLHLIAQGSERFTIRSLDKEALPYLIGQVEAYPLAIPDLPALETAALGLYTWLARYIKLLNEAGNTQFDLERLPREPVAMAYAAAAMTDVPAQQKQELLSQESALDLIAHLNQLYKREVALLRAQLNETGNQSGSFSQN